MLATFFFGCLPLASPLSGPVLWCSAAGVSKTDKPDAKKRKPGFTIGKETTLITGPLDEDGFVDYPTALNRRFASGVTADNNAFVLLVRAFGPKLDRERMPAEFYKWLSIDEPAAKGEYFIEGRQYLQEHAAVDPDRIDKELYEATQRPWAAKERPAIADWLKANEKALELAVQASRRSHYFQPLIVDAKKKGPATLLAAPNPGAYLCRVLGDALVARAMNHIDEGRADEAWQDLMAVHRLARLVGKAPTLIDGLAATSLEERACEGDAVFAAEAKLDSKKIQARLDELKTLAPMPPMADRVDVGERFWFLDAVMMISRDVVAGMGDWRKQKEGILKDLPDDIDWDPALKTGNRFYDRLIAAMRLKDRALRGTQLEGIENELKEMKTKLDKDLPKLGPKDLTPTLVSRIMTDTLVPLFIPAVQKALLAEDRSQQKRRNALVAFALAAHRRDNGSYPEKLDALVPKYLDALPQDLFSGKALVYRAEQKSYLLYSVGADGKDGGGRSFDEEPPGDDLVVEAPLRKLKRE